MTSGRRLLAALTVLVTIGGCSPKPTDGANSGVGRGPSRSSTPPRSSSSAPPPPPPTWHLASLPATKPTSILRDVVAVDATNAWAVGSDAYSPTEQYTTGVPLILQWNGSTWSSAQVPANTGTTGLKLVAASSATDVWAIGGPMSHDINDNVTIVLRYDGSTWRQAPFPAGATPSFLSITDLSVVDGHAWLVGYRNTAVAILEWNGQTWQEHQPPAECVQGGTSFGGMPNFCNVTAIKAFAANDIWAAGNGAWNGFLGPLLYHWNGTEWRAVKVGLNQDRLALDAIDGRSPTDIWAAGDTLMSGGAPLVVHGDGTTWNVVGGVPTKALPGITVDTAGTPWLIENSTAPSANLGTYRPTGPWTDTPAPTPPDTVGMSLHAITAIPGTTHVLAVGAADLPTTPRLLRAVILEYS